MESRGIDRLKKWCEDNPKRVHESTIIRNKRWKENNPNYMKEWKKRNRDHIRNYDLELRRKNGVKPRKILTLEERMKAHRLSQKKQQDKHRAEWINLIIIPRGWNRCKKCGYDKCFDAIEFHHRNPEEKDFPISDLWSKSITEQRIKEFEKTDSLCANCHREIHVGTHNGKSKFREPGR